MSLESSEQRAEGARWDGYLHRRRVARLHDLAPILHEGVEFLHVDCFNIRCASAIHLCKVS